MECSLTNMGTTKCTYTFDLTDQPDFSIVLPSNRENFEKERLAYKLTTFREDPRSWHGSATQYMSQIDDLQQSIKEMETFVNIGEFATHDDRLAYESQISVLRSRLSDLELASYAENVEQVHKRGHQFTVEVGPDQTRLVYLDMLPDAVASFNFQVPVAINGVPCFSWESFALG